MSGRPAWPQHARTGTLQAVASAVRGFLLDPPEADARNPVAGAARRPVIAVFGLAVGCGATVVARGVAVELAARDPTGTCVVASDSKGSGMPLATAAATRLARALEDLPGGARPLGRLCIVRGADPSSLADALPGLAPLVIDAGSAALGGAPACVADRTLVVTTPAIEPALARVAIDCVSRVGPEPTVVLNRARPRDDPPDAAATRDPPLQLPDARLGAQLALSGREVRGALGRAISDAGRSLGRGRLSAGGLRARSAIASDRPSAQTRRPGGARRAARPSPPRRPAEPAVPPRGTGLGCPNKT